MVELDVSVAEVSDLDCPDGGWVALGCDAGPVVFDTLRWAELTGQPVRLTVDDRIKRNGFCQAHRVETGGGHQVEDDDGDGVSDLDDDFPLDPRETTDTDGDGLGDGEDRDDDGDGIPDDDDLHPLEVPGAAYASTTMRSYEWSNFAPRAVGDVDGDGIVDFVAHYPQMTFMPGGGLVAADRADGLDDQTVEFRNWRKQPGSYRFVDNRTGGSWWGLDDLGGAGDVDGDGSVDLMFSHEGRATVVSASDLAEADNADDGTAVGVIHEETFRSDPWPAMWSFRRGGTAVQFGASPGDVDLDGRADLLVSVDSIDFTVSTVYLAATKDLEDADAADGVKAGGIDVENLARLPNSYQFVRKAHYVEDHRRDGTRERLRTRIWLGDYGCGNSPAVSDPATRAGPAGDVDGDGLPDLMICEHWESNSYNAGYGEGSWRRDSWWIVLTSGLARADAADGRTDGVVFLENALEARTAWKFTVEAECWREGPDLLGPCEAERRNLFSMELIAARDDLDGDGQDDFLLNNLYFAPDPTQPVFVISSSDLPRADAADGEADRRIRLPLDVPPRAGSWWKIRTLNGTNARDVNPAGGDVDGDGHPDLLLSKSYGPVGRGPYGQFVFSVADLPAADAADGNAGGVMSEAALRGAARTWNIHRCDGSALHVISSQGDVDGDGRPDLGVAGWRGCRYLLLADELRLMDMADGTEDREIDAGNFNLTVVEP